MMSAKFSLGSALVALGALVSIGGCAHNANDNPVVPSSAVQVSSGDMVLSYTAPRDGVIYLRDDQDNRILYSTDVKANQTVKYDPQAADVTINDNVAAPQIASNNHQHSLFFQPYGGPEAATAGATTQPAQPTTQPSSSAGNDNVPIIHVPVGVRVDVQTQPSAGQ